MSFEIGTTKVRIDFLFFFMLSLMCLYDQRVTLTVLGLSLLHELGHFAAIRGASCTVKELHISSFGMVIKRNEDVNVSFQKEAVIAFAGPFVNLVLAAILIKINREASVLSFLLAVFNLLPVTALDGGKITVSLLLCLFSEPAARSAARVISGVTLVVMTALGVYALIINPRNLSILLIVVYLSLFMINKPLS